MRRLQLPPQPRSHVLAFGGGSDPRKRMDLMLAVYREYMRSAPHTLPLMVLTRAGLLKRHADALSSVNGTTVAASTEDDVTRLLASAGALLYTSKAEGFGLPIVEAAEVGTPVVMDGTADIATEAIGSHCFLVRDPNPSAWAATLHRAVEAAPIHHALALPDWSDVADRYAQLYHGLA